jgi:hypothetical protein
MQQFPQTAEVYEPPPEPPVIPEAEALPVSASSVPKMDMPRRPLPQSVLVIVDSPPESASVMSDFMAEMLQQVERGMREMDSLLVSETQRQLLLQDDRVPLVQAPSLESSQSPGPPPLSSQSPRQEIWCSSDQEALRALTEANREERIAGRPCQHLLVWDRTCGGREFVEIGMLPCWKDEGAPRRLSENKDRLRHKYPFSSDEEEAFSSLLKEEMDEEIVSPVPHTYPKFLNPVFMVPKKGNKWRKVVDCRWLNLKQTFQHFRMEGPEVVQQLALPGDWATSLDIKSASNTTAGTMRTTRCRLGVGTARAFLRKHYLTQ